MRNKNQNVLRLMVISVVATISLLIGLVVYYDSLTTNLQDTTCKTLNEVMQQEKNSFEKMMNADKAALKGFAELIPLSADNSSSLLLALETITQSTDFEYVTFAATDGVSINNKGETADVSDRDYFKAALSGETVISEPVRSKLRDINIIVAATPVTRNGKAAGVLFGSFAVNKLNASFMSSFGGYGYTFIATNTGELIAKSDNENAMTTAGNLFDFYKTTEFYKNDSYETMCQNLVDGKGGHSQYRLNDQRRLMHYDKLPINGWNIFSVVSPTAVETTANQILRNAIVLTGALVAIFFALLFYNLISQKRFTRELTKMAYTDDITGFRSFGKFKIDAAELIKKNPDITYMLIKTDIENFKIINEIYTMETGDRVLRAIAETLNLTLDSELDAFGRIHADEFVLLVNCPADEGYLQKRQKFDELFSARCKNLLDFKLVLPQGRYLLQKGETDFAQIFEKVNFAHRLAKSSDSKELDFDGKVKERALREKEIERKMENALQMGEFQLYLQPKYRLKDEKIIGAEALVRWIPDGEAMIYPSEFIPLFEQNGFITQIDKYIFEKACKTLRRWIDEGIEPLAISVNFSRQHLNSPTFVDELCQIADRYQISHRLLEVELTETTMLESLDILEEVLNKLHQAGFTLSMDDFGTGYSSLGLLKDICVDVIKIDKGFFDYTRDLERAKTVISSVMEMARKLDIRTVAEGVETQAHINLLGELGCETVQGYYFAKPMPVEQLETKLLHITGD